MAPIHTCFATLRKFLNLFIYFLICKMDLTVHSLKKREVKKIVFNIKDLIDMK